LNLRFAIYDLRALKICQISAMTRQEMRSRTKAFASRVVKLFSSLPEVWMARTLGKQLLRAGTCVGANYRAVYRAKSNADFLNKLRIIEEESGESPFWMKPLMENGLAKPAQLGSLMGEANEILAIVVASIKTARSSTRA
jgi:four helix bundle protein